MLILHFDGALQQLLPRRYRSGGRVYYSLTRRASIKDIVESLHIPHTEVWAMSGGDKELSFSHVPGAGEKIRLYSFPNGVDVTQPTFLRPTPLPEAAFSVDINVGRLARLLRMAGLDTWYDPQLTEKKLAAQSTAHGRVLLSRNRDLLQRKCITWGRLVRAEMPEQQLTEIISLYGLYRHIAPFSRCLECNAPLQPVAKSAIVDRLEPLTRKYYHRFKRCPGCDRIYWQGSHHQRMQKIITRLTTHA